MPRSSAAGLDFRMIPAGFNAPLEFLTGFTTDTYTPIERKPIPSWKCFPDDEPIGVLAEISVKIPLIP